MTNSSKQDYEIPITDTLMFLWATFLSSEMSHRTFRKWRPSVCIISYYSQLWMVHRHGGCHCHYLINYISVSCMITDEDFKTRLLSKQQLTACGQGSRGASFFGVHQIKSNQVYLYTAYFYKIQGCLQYKTIYVKINIKLKKFTKLLQIFTPAF